MSVDGWNTLLVLGGIHSGTSGFAESLLSDVPSVRYLTLTSADPDHPRLTANARQQPEHWTLERITAHPSALAEVINATRPDETLLVADLGGWVAVLLDPVHQPADDVATIAELATAVRNCTARLVLVSPEAELSPTPATPLGRAFTDALGETNRAIADASDAVVLVVAGQPCWLKPAVPRRMPTLPVQGAPAMETLLERKSIPLPQTQIPAPAAMPAPRAGIGADAARGEPSTAWTAPTMALPMVATGLVIQPGMELPMPDERAGEQASDRLATLDVPGPGFGTMARVVDFAAATQGTPTPATWEWVRVLLLRGDHEGGAAAGCTPGESARRAEQAANGFGPLAQLATENHATLQIVDAPTAAPMEHGPALTAEAVESALRHGWRVAEKSADAGAQLLVLAACGIGAEAAAAAVLAATAGAEPPAVLGRVVTPDGRIDDAAWMARCIAIRDALHRSRTSSRTARETLTQVGGGDLATATGILLGAAARRLPVLLDGPVGVAAAILSRDLSGQTQHWYLLPDHGGHPAVMFAANVLGLTPLLDLKLGLGEGANALAVLPLLRSMLALGRTLPPHPRRNLADGTEHIGPESGGQQADPDPMGE